MSFSSSPDGKQPGGYGAALLVCVAMLLLVMFYQRYMPNPARDAGERAQRAAADQEARRARAEKDRAALDEAQRLKNEAEQRAREEEEERQGLASAFTEAAEKWVEEAPGSAPGRMIVPAILRLGPDEDGAARICVEGDSVEGDPWEQLTTELNAALGQDWFELTAATDCSLESYPAILQLDLHPRRVTGCYLPGCYAARELQWVATFRVRGRPRLQLHGTVPPPQVLPELAPLEVGDEPAKLRELRQEELGHAMETEQCAKVALALARQLGVPGGEKAAADDAPGQERGPFVFYPRQIPAEEPVAAPPLPRAKGRPRAPWE